MVEWVRKMRESRKVITGCKVCMLVPKQTSKTAERPCDFRDVQKMA
jgi:hypothetical protein